MGWDIASRKDGDGTVEIIAKQPVGHQHQDLFIRLSLAEKVFADYQRDI